jgi:hypothetical protein
MSRRRLGIGLTALALLGLGWWWLRAPDKSESVAAHQSEASKATPPPLSRHKLQRDVSGLARALSTAASRTLGLVMVTGHVRDAYSREPVAGAEVIFTGPSGESSARTDESGIYSIELLPGLYRSFAQGSEYVAVARQEAQRLPGPVSAAEVGMPQHGLAPLAGFWIDRHGVDLFVERGGTIRGRVLDPGGNPVAGAIVAAHSPRTGTARLISGADVTESAGDGSYEVRVRARTVEMQVTHDAYAGLAGPASIYVGPGQVQELDLHLAAGCIIEGIVVDVQGQPIAEGSFERYVGGTPPNDFSPIGKIDEAGRVRYTQSWEGDVRLRAWPWGHAASEVKSYSCKDGLHYSGETFVIPNVEPSIEGSVVSYDGAPVPLAFVDIFPLSPGGMSQQERADYDGKFSFHNLPEGKYQVTTHVPGQGVALDFVSIPSKGVRLELSGSGSIVGTTDGLPSGAFRLRYRCTLEIEDSQFAKSDALSMPWQDLLVPVGSGTFRIDELPACTIVGFAESDAGSVPISAEIEARSETPLRVSFIRGEL